MIVFRQPLPLSGLFPPAASDRFIRADAEATLAPCVAESGRSKTSGHQIQFFCAGTAVSRCYMCRNEGI